MTCPKTLILIPFRERGIPLLSKAMGCPPFGGPFAGIEAGSLDLLVFYSYQLSYEEWRWWIMTNEEHMKHQQWYPKVSRRLATCVSLLYQGSGHHHHAPLKWIDFEKALHSLLWLYSIVCIAVLLLWLVMLVLRSVWHGAHLAANWNGGLFVVSSDCVIPAISMCSYSGAGFLTCWMCQTMCHMCQ